jgi:hypothetical protein
MFNSGTNHTQTVIEHLTNLHNEIFAFVNMQPLNLHHSVLANSISKSSIVRKYAFS